MVPTDDLRLGGRWPRPVRMVKHSVHTMTKVAAVVLLAIVPAACASVPIYPPGPTSPAESARIIEVPKLKPTWGLSGQSNAVLLRPLLERYADVVGFAEDSRPIDWWHAPDGAMWQQLLPKLGARLELFIWFQGEADWDKPAGYYRRELRNLAGRVRKAAHNPRLMIAVCELAPLPRHHSIREEQLAFVRSDSHVVFVRTADLPFIEDVHLAPDGRERLAARIYALWADLQRKGRMPR